MNKRRHRQLKDEEKSEEFRCAKIYLESLSKEVTSSSLFVDATAMVDCHDHKSVYRTKAMDFLQKEAAIYRFYTSSYVVAEVVRKIIHPSRGNDFRNPDGVTMPCQQMASFMVNEWMDTMKIKTVHVPEVLFVLGTINLKNNKSKQGLSGWTLTDAISYEIVKGLGQKSIMSSDTGFRTMGLWLLP